MDKRILKSSGGEAPKTGIIEKKKEKKT